MKNTVSLLARAGLSDNRSRASFETALLNARPFEWRMNARRFKRIMYTLYHSKILSDPCERREATL